MGKNLYISVGLFDEILKYTFGKGGVQDIRGVKDFQTWIKEGNHEKEKIVLSMLKIREKLFGDNNDLQKFFEELKDLSDKEKSVKDKMEDKIKEVREKKEFKESLSWMFDEGGLVEDLEEILNIGQSKEMKIELFILQICKRKTWEAFKEKFPITYYADTQEDKQHELEYTIDEIYYYFNDEKLLGQTGLYKKAREISKLDELEKHEKLNDRKRYGNKYMIEVTTGNYKKIELYEAKKAEEKRGFYEEEEPYTYYYISELDHFCTRCINELGKSYIDSGTEKINLEKEVGFRFIVLDYLIQKILKEERTEEERIEILDELIKSVVLEDELDILNNLGEKICAKEKKGEIESIFLKGIVSKGLDMFLELMDKKKEEIGVKETMNLKVSLRATILECLVKSFYLKKDKEPTKKIIASMLTILKDKKIIKEDDIEI